MEPQTVDEVQTMKDMLVCNACNCAPSEPQHECPYKSDVHDDKVFKCNCCELCQQVCVDDI